MVASGLSELQFRAVSFPGPTELRLLGLIGQRNLPPRSSRSHPRGFGRSLTVRTPSHPTTEALLKTRKYYITWDPTNSTVKAVDTALNFSFPLIAKVDPF